jgi:hypothetical protein
MIPRFKTLGEYIEYTQEQEQVAKEPEPNPDQYPVYPPQQGEEDRARNAYSQV